jgi:hypothetical protein
MNKFAILKEKLQFLRDFYQLTTEPFLERSNGKSTLLKSHTSLAATQSSTRSLLSQLSGWRQMKV